MKFITKTIYLQFIACPKNTWLQLNKPELAASFALSDFEKSLVAKGNLVELWARKLFSQGVMVEEFGHLGHEITQKHLAEKSPVIFQSTFIKDNFFSKNDVLEYDSATDSWNLYEIKGTNTLNENENENLADHIDDAAFQLVILQDLGIRINKISILHLNRDYIRGEEIEVRDLFLVEDVSETVKDRITLTTEKMKLAARFLSYEDESALECQCLYRGRSNHCSTFSYSHPEVPVYSVHDLSRIGNSKKKLANLVDSNIFSLEDISNHHIFSKTQQNQIAVHKSQLPLIDLESIRSELATLVYPLYFLDYETYPAAIPLFKGFKPYQQIPFQFSLHVLRSENSELEHFEYLQTEAVDPSLGIIESLKKIIGPVGSIIVWNKKFEQGINAALAKRHPDDAAFLNDINERVYDLIDIFQKQFYVHHGFKGKTSIKNVLPVLVPDLSYKSLEIQKGDVAMEAWYEMVFGDLTPEEKTIISKNLLDYCCLDTYAMYAIWQKLRELL
ncbi:MAG: DUF2779 domain-containing protein [Candidatus Falkowbacteria bacterium]